MPLLLLCAQNTTARPFVGCNLAAFLIVSGPFQWYSHLQRRLTCPAKGRMRIWAQGINYGQKWKNERLCHLNYRVSWRPTGVKHTWNFSLQVSFLTEHRRTFRHLHLTLPRQVDWEVCVTVRVWTLLMYKQVLIWFLFFLIYFFFSRAVSLQPLLPWSALCKYCSRFPLWDLSPRIYRTNFARSRTELCQEQQAGERQYPCSNFHCMVIASVNCLSVFYLCFGHSAFTLEDVKLYFPTFGVSIKSLIMRNSVEILCISQYIFWISKCLETCLKIKEVDMSAILEVVSGRDCGTSLVVNFGGFSSDLDLKLTCFLLCCFVLLLGLLRHWWMSEWRAWSLCSKFSLYQHFGKQFFISAFFFFFKWLF